MQIICKLMDFKEIKVTSLKPGMKLVNIGTVERISEYSNVVIVVLSWKKIKEENDYITFGPYDRVMIEQGIDN